MIGTKDIRKAVVQRLKKTGHKVIARDVEKGFERPAFFVELDNNVRFGTAEQVERSLTVRIYYFPTDRYEHSVEVLDTLDQVETLFDLKLQVNDRWLNVNDFRSTMNEGVLICTFDTSFIDARSRNILQDPRDPMETLDVDMTMDITNKRSDQ